MISAKRNILLKDFSNYKIGGPADYFLDVHNKESLHDALCFANEKKLPYFILGGATNLLIPDGGYRGVIIKLSANVIKDLGDGKVYVEAGVDMAELLNFVIARGLAGLEWAGGLPGTFGGAVRGNAGAFGGEIKDSIQLVTTIKINESNANNLQEIARENSECNFSYRTSIFKELHGREIIFSAILKLSQDADPEKIRKIMQEKIDYRKARQPLEYPNIGSVFKNCPFDKLPPNVQQEFRTKIKTDPFPVLPTAHLILGCGLRGLANGGAQISEKHPNFIINKNNASANDVKKLMSIIKECVFKKYGVELEQEVEILT